jgi:pimeloyl-ACP methyl ester carboxylesterase
MRPAWVPLISVGLALAAGCGESNARYMAESRKDKGLILILPGIEGESAFNRNIRDGLVRARIGYAMPIVEWGWPIPLLGTALNQVDVIGHYAAGKRIARSIRQYQENYPDRPVFVIGHSGGGGLAVLALEALSDLSGARPIDGAILLSPSISASHDLTKALRSCRLGIVNFYNERDLAVLGLGTILLGNVDGGHGASAGRAGFDTPEDSGPLEKQRAYISLHQVEVTPAMTRDGTAHTANTSIRFVTRYVAEWVLASRWPPEAAAVVGR